MNLSHILSTPFLLLFLFLCISLIFVINGNASDGDDAKQPYVLDSNLNVELVYSGLEFPTTMAFIAPDDILVLEKTKGTVERITNGAKWPEPLLDVNVSHKQERGMLGIAVAPNKTDNPNPYVFLYFTKSGTDGDDAIQNETYKVSNQLYRYELVNNSKLQNPKLLLSMPSTWRSFHVGGDLLIGPDNNLYLTTGDQTRYKTTQAQNIKNGSNPDGTSAILRMTFDGQPPSDNIFGEKYPLSLYYAYGIRNSFGIDFDPITGKLWDTETGPEYGDEINLVEPGFNSGWSKVQGIWAPMENRSNSNKDLSIGNRDLNPHKLVSFDGKGKYSSPEFTWKNPACVIAIKFFNSGKYGEEYKNDVFVGTSGGNLYHFNMNQNRDGFILDNNLEDKIAENDSHEELAQLRFGGMFGAISDMQVGYDGILYIVSVEGAIYKIVPKDIELTKDKN